MVSGWHTSRRPPSKPKRSPYASKECAKAQGGLLMSVISGGFSFTRSEYLRDATLVVQSLKNVHELALPRVDSESSATMCIRWGDHRPLPNGLFGALKHEAVLGRVELASPSLCFLRVLYRPPKRSWSGSGNCDTLT